MELVYVNENIPDKSSLFKSLMWASSDALTFNFQAIFDA